MALDYPHLLNTATSGLLSSLFRIGLVGILLRLEVDLLTHFMYGLQNRILVMSSLSWFVYPLLLLRCKNKRNFGYVPYKKIQKDTENFLLNHARGGGVGSLGHQHSVETKLKMSAAHTDREYSWLIGTPRPPASNAKTGTTMLIRWHEKGKHVELRDGCPMCTLV